MRSHAFYQLIASCLQVSRLPVSLFAACSAGGGYVIAGGESPATLAAVGVGVFLLACGASALNQYQEMKIDACMDRTRLRPLPSGRMTPRTAVLCALVAGGFGAVLVWNGGGWMPLVIAIGAVVWYNGVYTCLKRISAFALIPGALSGALPPAVGWVSGGGSLADPALWALSLFFWVWQVPHFWLLIMRYGREYTAAGLPSLTEKFEPDQLSRLVFLWICATAVSSLLLFMYGLVNAVMIRYLLLGISTILIGLGVVLLMRGASFCRTAFGWINSYMMVVLVLLSCDRLLLSNEFRWMASAVLSIFSAKSPSCFM